MCLSKKSPITNCVAIPGRPPSLYSGAISPSMNSQSILPASCTSSCLMLMIWSSRARNKSPDPVVSCFFGRIAPSDAATESCFSIRGNGENEIASFSGLEVLHGRLLNHWATEHINAMPYPEHLAEARRLAKECIADAKKQGISKKELDEDLLKDLVSELKDRLDADGEPTLIPDAANTRLKAQSKST